MYNQKLKPGVKDGSTTTTTMENNKFKTRRGNNKRPMAQRGLKSLAFAITLPVVLTISSIYLFGSTDGYNNKAKPTWFPPLWLLHVAHTLSVCIISLSAWLVWAEDGFRRRPDAFFLYLAQLGLGLAWEPIVFKVGCNEVGFGVALGLCGTLLGCSKVFRQVNPTAAFLVKPCLAWAVCLALLNLKLSFL